MKLTINRIPMSGSGPKYTYAICQGDKFMFQDGQTQGYFAWTRKKDAQRIIDAIEIHGLEYVEEKLGRKAGYYEVKL